VYIYICNEACVYCTWYRAYVLDMCIHTLHILWNIYIYIYIYTVYIMYRYAIYVDSHCICNHVHRCITNAYLLYIICITHIYIYTHEDGVYNI